MFDAAMGLLDAALLVVTTGWDLAVVLDDEPRVVTARSVFRALVGGGAATASPASLIRSCALAQADPVAGSALLITTSGRPG